MKKVKTKKKSKPPIRVTSGEPEGKAKSNGSRNKAKPAERARIERKRYNTKLPVAIPPELVVLRADELAKAVREREAHAEEHRARMADDREKRAHFDEKISELATAVEQHTETREVEVVEYLVEGTGNLEVVRQDTLEVIETKAASAEDLQESIFAKIDKAKGEDKASPKREANSKIVEDVFGVPSALEDDEDADDENAVDWSVDPKNPDVRKLTPEELDARIAKLNADKAERAEA